MHQAQFKMGMLQVYRWPIRRMGGNNYDHEMIFKITREKEII